MKPLSTCPGEFILTTISLTINISSALALCQALGYNTSLYALSHLFLTAALIWIPYIIQGKAMWSDRVSALFLTSYVTLGKSLSLS